MNPRSSGPGGRETRRHLFSHGTSSPFFTLVMLHHGEFQHFPHLGQVFQTLLYGQLLHGVHHDLLGYFLVFSQLHREHVLQGEPVERGTGSVFEERGRKLNALELANFFEFQSPRSRTHPFNVSISFSAIFYKEFLSLYVYIYTYSVLRYMYNTLYYYFVYYDWQGKNSVKKKN